jgi:hypothetical protein
MAGELDGAASAVREIRVSALVLRVVMVLWLNNLVQSRRHGVMTVST